MKGPQVLKPSLSSPAGSADPEPTGGPVAPPLPLPRADQLRLVTHGREEGDLYRSAFHDAPLAMALLDDDGRFARVNEALCCLLGYTSEDLLGLSYEQVVYPSDHPAADEHPPGADTDECKLRHRDGQAVWVRASARTMTGSDGWTIRIWEDVDERRRTHERLSRLALHDPLTGVGNRTLLDDRLTQALRTRDRDGGVVAVLFCDVDAFKAVNDSYGHGFGDILLGVVAARLTSAVRAGDTVARVGGDEFVVVSLLHDMRDADALLLRVGESLGDAIHEPGGMGMPLSVSVGMAIADGPEWTAADLLDRADRQMYAVKRRRVPTAED
jgi:diguanylate cyclase (GGDEF)-like protein/PAS domain S-box-containing protein